MANKRVTSSHLLRYTAPVNHTCEAPTREGRERRRRGSLGGTAQHSTARLGWRQTTRRDSGLTASQNAWHDAQRGWRGTMR